MNVYNNENVIDQPADILIKNQSMKECKPPDFELMVYEMGLKELLQETKNFRQFKMRITAVLQHIGFSDWAYSRLDVPPALSIDDLIGTPVKEQLEYFSSNEYYDCDLTFQYVKESKSRIFRSSINSYLKRIPSKIEIIYRHNEIIKMYKSFGYHDHLAIPLYSEGKENHAFLSLAANGADSKTFRDLVHTHSSKIDIITRLIERVGIEKYPHKFIGTKNSFEKLMNGRSMKLLKLMASNDFKLSQAAAALHMSRTAADKQIAKIRDYLGVNTTHGAVHEAIRQGFISPDKGKINKQDWL